MSYESGGAVLSGCTGTSLSTGLEAANTKPTTYTTLLASTATTYQSITVTVHEASLATAPYLIDIALGADGVEEILIPDLFVHGGGPQGSSAYTVTLPLLVPASTRISARCQCGTVPATIRVSVLLGTSALYQPYQRCTAYGVVAASSAGTTVDPGASANTKATTAIDNTGLTLALDAVFFAWNRRDAAIGGNVRWLFDLIVGAATIVPDMAASSSTNVDATGLGFHGPFYVGLAAGSLLDIKAACNSGGSDRRTCDCVIYGLDDQLGA